MATVSAGASVPTRKAGNVSPATIANRLDGCANWLHFRHYTGPDEVRLHSAQFCKQYMLCGPCAIRRGSKMMSVAIPKFEAVCADDPSLKPALVTLTVKNRPNLPETMDHLIASVRTLMERRRAVRKGNRGLTQFAKVAGAFGSYEVTKSEKGWHPHVHMVVLLEDWIDQAALSREWHSITGDSFIVDVRRLSPGQDPSEAFAEVCKYALKASSMAPADVWEAFLALKTSRLVFTLGNMRGVKIPEELTDEPLEGLPYVDWFYRFVRGKGYELDLPRTMQYRQTAQAYEERRCAEGRAERAPP